MMIMKTTVLPLKKSSLDPVSIRGVSMVPMSIEARNWKIISSRSGDISNFTKLLTMNDPNPKKTEKTSKRTKQKNFQRQCFTPNPNGNLKREPLLHEESRLERRSTRELESKPQRTKLSVVKPAWERVVKTDAKSHPKSDLNKIKMANKVNYLQTRMEKLLLSPIIKNYLKPVKYEDPALLKLRSEKQKQRAEKMLLKERSEEMKNKQRREIYALNEVMKKLEYDEFKRFCFSAGIDHEE